MASIDVVSDTPRISFREIDKADIGGAVDLLTTGFRSDRRSRAFWVRAFRRLSEHATPEGFPKYGYLLECKGTPVGLILLIFSSIPVDGAKRIRCSVSSWYVDPAFRCYAPMFVSRALRHKNVTYYNITPRRHTYPILEAQGYVRYCTGRFVSVPMLSTSTNGCRVKMVTRDIRADEDLPSAEIDLLLVHASYGCMSLTCSSANGSHPFVFMPRKKFGLVPFAYLAYCRDVKEFVQFAGPLGRFLAGRGFPLIVLDSNGPVPGLIGIYSDSFPKYFKGPVQPRLGDYAYSERVMFGV
jgi:hypothetical protein